MADYTDKQLERMVYSKKWHRREAAAKAGFGLEILVDDEDPCVRAAVAEQGYGLGKLVHDDNWLVKIAVAEQGYGLERYVDDMSGLVRKAVAQHGYRLDLLLNDPFPDVRAAARTYVFERLPVEFRTIVTVPLAEIGLPTRIVNCLLPGSPGGLRIFGDLMMEQAERLELWSGLGEKSHRDIQEKFVAFFEALKPVWCFREYESMEGILEAFKGEVEKVAGARVNGSGWYMHSVCLQTEKTLLDVLEDASFRAQIFADNLDKKVEYKGLY